MPAVQLRIKFSLSLCLSTTVQPLSDMQLCRPPVSGMLLLLIPKSCADSPLEDSFHVLAGQQPISLGYKDARVWSVSHFYQRTIRALRVHRATRMHQGNTCIAGKYTVCIGALLEFLEQTIHEVSEWLCRLRRPAIKFLHELLVLWRYLQWKWERVRPIVILFHRAFVLPRNSCPDANISVAKMIERSVV